MAATSGAGALDMDASMVMVDESNLDKISSIYKRGRIVRSQEQNKVAKGIVAEAEEKEQEAEGSGDENSYEKTDFH